MINFDAFYKISYGLYVVSSSFSEKSSGYICNAVMQVTSQPIQLTIACNKANYTAELIQKSQKVAVAALNNNISPSVISDFGYQSGRDVDKFAKHSFLMTENNIPVLKNNVAAWFEGHVVNQLDLGSHILFFVIVDNAQVSDDKEEVLTYSYYRNVFKGKSPKNAPTYINPELHSDSENKSKKSSGKIWICQICGYEYDSAKGDPDSGIAPGTAFEDIPEDWRCPICKTKKSDFKLKE